MQARSFLVPTPEGDALARALLEAHRAVPRATAGIVFVSGPIARQATELGALLAKLWKGVPTLVIPSAGVLSDRGEVERLSAVSGVLWRGGRAETWLFKDDRQEVREGLRAAWKRASERPRTLLLFARPDAMGLESLEGIAEFAPDLCLFGAGTVGGQPVAVDAAGRVESGRAAALGLSGVATPIVETSPGVRLVSPFAAIEEAHGGMVARIGDRPALEALSAAASAARGLGAGSGQPVVFAALTDDDPAEGAPRFAVRNIRGIDPAHGGLVIGPEAEPGVRCAFAVLDGAQARTDLEQAAKRVFDGSRGSAPAFALFLSCAGRGSGLYGASDVESRILRKRFGDLPIAGMQSAFEIGPWCPGRAKLHFFTGVLALFRSPS